MQVYFRWNLRQILFEENRGKIYLTGIKWDLNDFYCNQLMRPYREYLESAASLVPGFTVPIETFLFPLI